MSTIESVIWHILGYSVIPVILVAGIIISSLVFFLLLRISGRGSDQKKGVSLPCSHQGRKAAALDDMQ